MKIAVIDEGVIPAFKNELNIVEDLMINKDSLVVNRPGDVQVITDHGFNVCKIINIYAPEAEIISIRIFSTLEMKANIEVLIAALKYCIDNRIPIIHLSGGTVNLFDDYILRDMIKKIINNNQIIVAAHSNNKGLSFPAIYPCVFSARAEELLGSFNKFKDSWGYSFMMPSQHKININKNLNYVTQIANSYAAPVLTANIYNIIKSSNSNKIPTILGKLGVTDNIFLCELPCFLDNVTIINLDSEVVVKEVLSFKVKSIYYDTAFEEDNGDYIFIPHKNRMINEIKFNEFISTLPTSDNRIRIVYLGTRDSNIELIMNGYPFEFWFLPADEIYPTCTSSTDLNDCATIYFQGKKEVVYRIMSQLKDTFLEEGFNCFATSDFVEATLYGIYYFRDIVNSIRKQQLEYVFEPDVELIYANYESHREIEDSMIIKVTKGKNKIKLLISVGDTKKEVEVYDIKDFRKLLSKIMNIG